MKIAIIVVVALVVLVGGILAYAASKPDTLRVQRSATIKAPPEKLFPLISNFHGWETWSPYEKKDPVMKRTFSGAESGVGAIYEWNGNKDVGSGRMEITEATAPNKIAIDLHFLTPFEAHNVAEFAIQPKGDSTEVTWTMHGPALFMTKVMGVFIDMDNMIGKDFEVGLSNLKKLTEQ